MPASLEVARRLMSAKPAPASRAPQPAPQADASAPQSFDACLESAASAQSVATPDVAKRQAASKANAAPAPRRDAKPSQRKPADAAADVPATNGQLPPGPGIEASAESIESAPEEQPPTPAATTEDAGDSAPDVPQLPPNLIASIQTAPDQPHAAAPAADAPAGPAAPLPATVPPPPPAPPKAVDASTTADAADPAPTEPRRSHPTPARPAHAERDETLPEEAAPKLPPRPIPAADAAIEHAAPQSAVLRQLAAKDQIEPASPRPEQKPDAPTSTEPRAPVVLPTNDLSLPSTPAAPITPPTAPETDAPAPAPSAPNAAVLPHISPAPHAPADGAQSAAPAQEPPRTTSDRTFDQIVLGLRTKLDANNQKAQIELNPPNLGRLQVAIEVSGGVLTAQFRASTGVVRDLLSSNMDRLRSVLEAQGITVDKLAVNASPDALPAAPAAGSGGTNSGLANDSHDGRSGGSFAHERQERPRHFAGDSFASIWQAAKKKEPIDLLA